MPDDVREAYDEAASVVDRSPRSAAALLRLGVQLLCVHLGQPGENLNDDIAALVRQDLPTTIQQALDVVRVVGNNAVHPGEMDVRDDRQTATALFGLVNHVVDRMISEPKRIAELTSKLPIGVQEAIVKRDAANRGAGRADD